MNREPPTVQPVSRTRVMALAIACGLFFLAEFTYQKQPHVRYEQWIGFYSFAALGATIGLSLVSVLLRPLLWRDPEYYDG